MKTPILTALAVLGSLSLSSSAQAQFTNSVRLCFQGRGSTTDGGLETLRLRGFKVWHGVGYTSSTNTDALGCVTVQVPFWESVARVKIQAENNVVAVLDGLIVAENYLEGANNQTFILSDNYYLAQKLKQIYLVGLAGLGPFGATRPVNGPYVITAVNNSPLIVSAPFVEPSPTAGTALPRIHLPPLNQEDLGTLRHEMGHAVHMAQLGIIERDFYQAEYLAALATNPGWGVASIESPLVAWVEAFGDFAETIAHPTINGSVTIFNQVDPASTLPAPFNKRGSILVGGGMTTIANNPNLWRDDVPGAVYAVLFLEYAPRVGMNFVLNTYVDCGAHNLQDYARCIHTRYGGTYSTQFRELRAATSRFNIQLDVLRGHWIYCTDNMPCGASEGDCDGHQQCQGALRCKSDDGAGGIDVCMPSTNGALDYCSREFPCLSGEGHCDNDNECAGNRRCTRTGRRWTCQPPLALPIVWP